MFHLQKEKKILAEEEKDFQLEKVVVVCIREKEKCKAGIIYSMLIKNEL